MREKNFEDKIKNWLETKGIYRLGTPKQNKTVPDRGNYFKMWGGGFQQAGIPDLICNINGKFVAIEVKGTGGRPSTLQELNIEAINSSNGLGMIVYPDDFEWLKNEIERLL